MVAWLKMYLWFLFWILADSNWSPKCESDVISNSYKLCWFSEYFDFCFNYVPLPRSVPPFSNGCCEVWDCSFCFPKPAKKRETWMLGLPCCVWCKCAQFLENSLHFASCFKYPLCRSIRADARERSQQDVNHGLAYLSLFLAEICL